MAVPRPLRQVAPPPPAVLAACLPKTLSRAVFQRVKGQVSPFVPCLAGGNDMPLIEAAQAIGMKLVFSRSEAGVGHAANGVIWETELPTICIVITSVGVYGLMQALYAARVNERPLVVLSGEVGGIGRGSVQAGEGWDGPSVTQVTDPLTAWSIDALTPSQAYRAVERAVQIASEERMPVHVNIPLSVQKEPFP